MSLIVLSGLFLALRLINLTIIPIFTDEAIYLRWGQIALADPRWRFISLTDGKQPLLIWFFLPALKLIVDPLVAGRAVSVLAGLVGMLGLSIFSWYRNKSVQTGLIGGLLYVVIPFFLVYDRLALYDGLLTSISIWVMFLTYLLGKKLRLDLALILGTLIGFGLLTKSSAWFFLMLLPTSLLLVSWRIKGKHNLWITIKHWIFLLMVVFIQAQIYNNITRLSEFRHMIGQKNLTFIFSFSEFIQAPLQSFWGNLVGLSSWTISYLTWPVVVLIIISFVWLLKNKFKEGLFFLSWFVLPFLALAFFGRVIYPRFVLFMIPPLLLPMAQFIYQLWKSKLNKQSLILGLILVFSLSGHFDYKLLTDPIHAPLPLADKQQLINDWPAGYGIREVVSFINDQSQTGKVIVGTEGTFGLFPMALELYLGENQNVTFKAYWPVGEVPKELLVEAKSYPTYLIFKERQDIPDIWPLALVAEYQRGDGPTYLRLFRVLP